MLTYLLHGAESFLRSQLVLQLIKKFPAFYGTTRKFITVLTSARHLSLSWVNSIQSPQPLPTSWRSILILSSHLRLDLPNGLFPSGFPTKTLCTPFPSSIRATCPVHLILLDFITRTILGEEYRSLSSLLCNFLHSCYPVPLRPKYSPQHPVLKLPQPMFLPQCQRPSFTTTGKIIILQGLCTQTGEFDKKTLIGTEGYFRVWPTVWELVTWTVPLTSPLTRLYCVDHLAGIPCTTVWNQLTYRLNELWGTFVISCGKFCLAFESAFIGYKSLTGHSIADLDV